MGMTKRAIEPDIESDTVSYRKEPLLQEIFVILVSFARSTS